LLIDLVIARSTNPNADSSAALQWAKEHGLDQFVGELIQWHDLDESLQHVGPVAFLLEWTVKKNCVPLLKMLLSDPRVDPSAGNQRPIRLACDMGHVEVAKVLLDDKRVDPSAEDQQAIRFASEKGHVEVVKLMLADRRVDPSSSHQYALRYACYIGHVEVVKLLLTDTRVDTSAFAQQAILWASQKGHADVVKLLLSDQRVDLSRLRIPSSPEVLALFSLRRSYRLFLERKQRATDSFPALRSVVADLNQIESQRKALLDDHLVSDLSNLCLEYVPDLFCHFDGKVSSLVDSNSDCKLPRFSFGNLSTL
jgi:hypothetical protein